MEREKFLICVMVDIFVTVPVLTRHYWWIYKLEKKTKCWTCIPGSINEHAT